MITPQLRPRDRVAVSIPLPQSLQAGVLELHLQPRYILHLAIILLAVTVVALSQLGAGQEAQTESDSGWSFNRLAVMAATGQGQYLTKPVLPLTSKAPVGTLTTPRLAFPELPGIPSLEVKKDRPLVTEHVVSGGETVSGIAQRYGVSTETIIWANQLESGDAIGIGDKLKVPAVTGVLHSVKSGETLAGVAERYGVDSKTIVEFKQNELAEPYALRIGQQLMVPGGNMPEPPRPAPVARGAAAPAAAPVAAPAPAPVPKPQASGSATGRFAWPTVGPIFTYFGGGHAGLDISPPYGTPIYAADGGKVISALKWDYSYGWHLIIDHGNGFQTLYGHASRFNVDVGDVVDKGQLIAWVGSTGKSTGPHVHFEIHRGGAAVDPLNYLP